jgi:excisionase family DNA binding protein
MLEATFSPPVRSVFVEEAATMLGVSRRTIYYRIREGRLRTMRTRCGSQRVLHESIETLLREDAAKRRARMLRKLPSKAEPLALQVQSLP